MMQSHFWPREGGGHGPESEVTPILRVRVSNVKIEVYSKYIFIRFEPYLLVNIAFILCFQI